MENSAGVAQVVPSAFGAGEELSDLKKSSRRGQDYWTKREFGAVDSNLLRQLNRSRIFHGVRLYPGSSQSEIAEVTGLTSGTVSNVVREFRSEGLIQVRRRERQDGEVGRPAMSLFVSKDAGIFAGVQFDMQYLTLVVTTLDGIPLGNKRLASATDVSEAVERAHIGLRDLVKNVGREMEDLRGVGVGVAGLVDHGHLVTAPYQNWVWRDVDLADLFRAKFGCPVYVENDAKSAALGERMFGAGKELDTFVVLAFYAGLGCGLYLQGNVFGGRGGLAGEIGHIKVVSGGRLCGCGGKGCLTAYASATSILRILRERGQDVESINDVVALAESGDSVTLGALKEAAGHLGHAIAIVVTMLSPQSVILGGELTSLAPYLMHDIERLVRSEILKQNWVDELLGISPLGEMQVPLGGIAMAIEGFLGLPRWMAAGQMYSSQ